MQSIKTSLVAISLAACIVIISSAPQEELKERISRVDESLDHSAATKGVPVPFNPPAFLAHALPQPVVFSNAATSGEVGALYSANNSTLIAHGGPSSDNTAVASLQSSTYYLAKPHNQTTNETTPDGTGTVGQGWGGFSITAQEEVQAYAVGDTIQFINNGASFANAAGQSTANGLTNNPGPANGQGWGSKVKDVDHPSKPSVQANSAER